MLHNVLQVVLLISHALHGVARLLHTQRKQCWFGRLAKSNIASACMTHLLLWGREKKPGGSRERAHARDTRAGRCSAKSQTKKLAA
jgi:hypothetical protein